MTKYKIVYVKEKIGNGFIGMNWYAAKELHIKFPYSKHTILIWKDFDKKRMRRTIQHEKVEIELMRRGMKYDRAHAVSNILEDYSRVHIVGP